MGEAKRRRQLDPNYGKLSKYKGAGTSTIVQTAMTKNLLAPAEVLGSEVVSIHMMVSSHPEFFNRAFCQIKTKEQTITLWSNQPFIKSGSIPKHDREWKGTFSIQIINGSISRISRDFSIKNASVEEGKKVRELTNSSLPTRLDHFSVEGLLEAKVIQDLPPEKINLQAPSTELNATYNNNWNAAKQFLLEVLQIVEGSEGNSHQVYAVWTKQQDQFNDELLAVFPSFATHLFDCCAEQQISVADVLIEFGNLILQFPLGQRWLNLELCISAYQQAMTVLSRKAAPLEWAITQTNLATAYCSRIRGDRAENIEEAIVAYKKALTVTSQNAMPVKWAGIMNNLAVAYKNRIRGKRADNIELAIAACQQVLTVRTRTEAPAEWAGTMSNLAGAYNERILGDRIDNIEQTIDACQQALTVRTRTDMPREWAQTTNNLASAYKGRLRGNRADNIKLAIAAYRQVLTVTTQSNMPIEWAGTMMNLATAYRDNTEGDRASNIEKAILAYQKVLTVRTQTALPIEWAEAINHLAAAFYRRIRGDHANNIETAISAYRQALIVRTQAALPIEWAGTMMNLAVAYQNRIEGNYADNIELAVTCYQNSLKVVQPTLLPHDCRRCARALANLYSDQQRWHKSVPIYKIALQAAENLYQSTNFLDSKTAELTETGDLICRASYAVARTGDFESAITILERGRTCAFNESLARNHADLLQFQEQHPDLYSQYQDVVDQIRNTDNQQRELKISQDRYSATSSVLRENVENLRQQLDAAIQSK